MISLDLDELTGDDLQANLPALTVRSWFIDGISPEAPKPFEHGLPTDPVDFLAQLPTDELSCWVRFNSGIVGFGRILRLRTTGTHESRFTVLDRAWKALAAAADIRDDAGMQGTGLLGFASLTFADDSPTESIIDIPRFLMGRAKGRVWLTSITLEKDDAANLSLSSLPLAPPQNPRVLQGHVTEAHYRDIVAQTSATLRSDDNDWRKMVLARDVVVETSTDLDVRAVLGCLHRDYPTCWTFDIAGLVGATPELLIGVQDGVVSSRVLAGTYRVAADPANELAAARHQLGAAKDTSEHRHAIDSLARALGPLSADLRVDESPHLLQLANVIHLASDAVGHLDGEAGERPSVLQVAQHVHPTAAVGGVPADAAAGEISRLEGTDRGRYAGPVGWINDRGNGQFGIALRCGQLEARNRIRLWAGAGIMPESDPESELAETAAKLQPMLRALGAANE